MEHEVVLGRKTLILQKFHLGIARRFVLAVTRIVVEEHPLALELVLQARWWATGYSEGGEKLTHEGLDI